MDYFSDDEDIFYMEDDESNNNVNEEAEYQPHPTRRSRQRANNRLLALGIVSMYEFDSEEEEDDDEDDRDYIPSSSNNKSRSRSAPTTATTTAAVASLASDPLPSTSTSNANSNPPTSSSGRKRKQSAPKKKPTEAKPAEMTTEEQSPVDIANGIFAVASVGLVGPIGIKIKRGRKTATVKKRRNGMGYMGRKTAAEKKEEKGYKKMKKRGRKRENPKKPKKSNKIVPKPPPKPLNIFKHILYEGPEISNVSASYINQNQITIKLNAEDNDIIKGLILGQVILEISNEVEKFNDHSEELSAISFNIHKAHQRFIAQFKNDDSNSLWTNEEKDSIKEFIEKYQNILTNNEISEIESDRNVSVHLTKYYKIPIIGLKFIPDTENVNYPIEDLQRLLTHKNLSNYFKLKYKGRPYQNALTFDLILSNESFYYQNYQQQSIKNVLINQDLLNFSRNYTPRHMYHDNEISDLNSVIAQLDKFTHHQFLELEHGIKSQIIQKKWKRGKGEENDRVWLFKLVKNYHSDRNNIFEDKYQQYMKKYEIFGKLRNYQKKALKWMLEKECCQEETPHESLYRMIFDKIFYKFQMNSNYDEEKSTVLNVYYNLYLWSLWCFNEERAVNGDFQDVIKMINPHKGGILADEMGLGKTLESLSLILLNQRTSDDVNIKIECENGFEKNFFEDISYHPAKRRKRESSPVEFDSSINNLQESVNSLLEPMSNGQRGRSKSKKNSISENEDSLNSSTTSKPKSRTNKRENSNNSKNEDSDVENMEEDEERNERGKKMKRKKQIPGENYERLRLMYESTLKEYEFSDRAHIQPFYNGTMFDTNVTQKSYFECLCGFGINHIFEGMDEDDIQYNIVTCHTCSSSQHISCVKWSSELSQKRSYYCPHCTVKCLDPIPSKTTLIITPTSLTYQWIEEIKHHLNDFPLKILYYKGVSYHGYLPPERLADFDIILTNYNVLGKEIDYLDLPHCNPEEGRRFRNPKRFLTIPTSLPNVEWWRICLDEAQMIEGIETKMAQMTKRLHAVNRWCVTGTPLSKNISELKGLYAFLKVWPISSDYWFEKLVSRETANPEFLKLLFGSTIWRTAKSDVEDQLGIPSQKEICHWLSFSPVEVHFYKKQYDVCSKAFLGKLRTAKYKDRDLGNIKLSSLDKKTLDSLMAPFLDLRQACCHPQMVKGNLISLSNQNKTLTMVDILDQLIKKASVQCAEDNRLIVSALNGMASIYILKEQWANASEKYREVLTNAEKYQSKFNTDSLQLLHTLDNLADLIDGHFDQVPHTLNDDKLRTRAKEIRDKYLFKYSLGVSNSEKIVRPITNSIKELEQKLVMIKKGDKSWWTSILTRASIIDKDRDLMHRIKEDLINIAYEKRKKSSMGSLANKFNDTNGLHHVLCGNLIELEGMRNSVLTSLEDLKTRDPSNYVDQAINCHLRKQTNEFYNSKSQGTPSSSKSKKSGGTSGNFQCDICAYHDQFLMYESILFNHIKVSEASKKRTGRIWQQKKIAGTDFELTEEEKSLALLREEEELLETTEHVNLGTMETFGERSWADSDTEKTLKIILQFGKLNGAEKVAIEDGNTHVKLFENMKKEYRYLRIFWRQIYDQVSAFDELSQATTRLQLDYGPSTSTKSKASKAEKQKKQQLNTLKDVTKDKSIKFENINLVQPHELDFKLNEFQGEYITSSHTLKVHLGQLIYLETLKKNDYGKKGSSNSEECPICTLALGFKWAVLLCGHSYCDKCIKKMYPNPTASFNCPLCRVNMKFNDVSFVDTTTRNSDEEMQCFGNKIASSSTAEASTSTSSSANTSLCELTTTPLKIHEIKGSHSTKIEAIVQTLLQISDIDPKAKSIVFSYWSEVLDILSYALEQNDVKFTVYNGGKSMKNNLFSFKKKEEIQVLLMLISSGSKGLNITEATHVLLAEPILDYSSEIQAIGRVHRIGQTKNTFVHKFYIKDTIEEKLFEILKLNPSSSSSQSEKEVDGELRGSTLTIEDLKNLVCANGSSTSAADDDALETNPIEIIDMDE